MAQTRSKLRKIRAVVVSGDPADSDPPGLRRPIATVRIDGIPGVHVYESLHSPGVIMVEVDTDSIPGEVKIFAGGDSPVYVKPASEDNTEETTP